MSRIAAIDAFRGYATGGGACLDAELVLDRFHVARLADTAVDVDHAHLRLIVFFQWCADAGMPELVRLASTIDRWTDELLAFHTTGGASNGPAEAVNLLIENACWVSYGFRNFNNYRLRLLLACGIEWQTPPVARIRGSQPRSSRRAQYRYHRPRQAVYDLLPMSYRV